MAVTGLVLFVRVEQRVGEPLLPLSVFTNHRNYPLAMVLLLVAGVVMFGGGLYLPLFQQIVQGASATNSGLLMLPMMIPVVIVSTLAGKVMSATGRYRIFPVVGTAFLTVGLGLLATMDTGTSRLLTGLYMVFVGIGLGFTLQMASTIAQNSVARAPRTPTSTRFPSASATSFSPARSSAPSPSSPRSASSKSR